MKLQVSKARNSDNGMEYISLENQFCRITVIPESGAKISELYYKPFKKNFVWENPRIKHTKPIFGLSYFLFDCSGWDECFPRMEPINDYFASIPEHGEVWGLPWNYEMLEENDQITLHCWVNCRIKAFKMDKWITLKPDEQNFTISYDIENLSPQSSRFQWTVHPMLNFGPEMRVDLPAQKITGYLFKENKEKENKVFDWPVELSSFSNGNSPEAFLVYTDPLAEGWWTLTDAKNQCGVGMIFPQDALNYIWLWVNYGGWGSYRHIAIEPATDPPGRNSSITPKQILAPREKKRYTINVIFYSGLSRVSSVTTEGKVIGK